MKNYIRLFIVFITINLFFSCEEFFTYNWFQGAADISRISAEEAINSGDKAIMQDVYDRIMEEAASESGSKASALYLDAADLALGISGMSDPTVLLSATTLFDSSGDTSSLFSIFTDTGIDTETLSDVDDILEAAETADPGSVPSGTWLFAAAGASADVLNAADAAGEDVDTYLASNPGPEPLDNAVIQNSIQYLINSVSDFYDDEVSPIEQMLIDNRTNLESYPGITYP
jgi:hypothetical protein